MLEQLPQRFRPNRSEDIITAEVPAKIVDTFLIESNALLEPDGVSYRLDADSRDTALVAGILNSAGLAEDIIVIAPNDESRTAAEEYLTKLDVKTENISFISNSKIRLDAKELEEIVTDNQFGEVATITIGNINPRTREELKRVGINLENLSPEEEIGKRITEAIKMSRKQAVEVLKTIFLNMIRFKNIPNIQITKLIPNTA